MLLYFAALAAGYIEINTPNTITVSKLTTTSVHRLIETETVVTPRYHTTTVFQEIHSTVTEPVYLTTTMEVFNEIPVYHTVTKTARQFLTTTKVYSSENGVLYSFCVPINI